VLASLKIEFLGEVVDGLFEGHTKQESTEQYKFSVEKPVYFNRCVIDEPPDSESVPSVDSELLRLIAS